MEECGIGWAVKQLHNRTKVRRAGWNGKGMYLFLVPAGTMEVQNFNGDAQPYVAMKTAQGTSVPWLASQTDLLATDWEVAE